MVAGTNLTRQTAYQGGCMSARGGVIRDDLAVEQIAAKNPLIDAHLFREWRGKMAVIERVNALLDSIHHSQNHPPAPRFYPPSSW